MEFNQLITKNQNEVTEGQRAFLNTHNEIMYNGRNMAESMVRLAVNLKTMRDDKLYLEAGFKNFEDYTETVGLGKTQAYKYITVLERHGEDFVHSSEQIGITKLALLAPLTDEERSQVVAQGKVADISVSELKKRIADLEQERKEFQGEYDIAQDTIKDLRKEFDQANYELEQTRAELENVNPSEHDEAAAELNKQIAKLQKEIKDLKSKPAEKEVVEKIVKDEKTAAELAAAKKELDKVLNVQNTQASLIMAKEAELAKVRKQLENAGDQKLLKFKLKFEELQALLGDVISCLGELSEDKQTKCKEAFKALIGGIAI